MLNKALCRKCDRPVDREGLCWLCFLLKKQQERNRRKAFELENERRQLTKEKKADLFSALAEKYENRVGINQHSDLKSLPSGKTAELVAKEVYGEDLDEKALKSQTRKVEKYLQYGKIIKEKPLN